MIREETLHFDESQNWEERLSIMMSKAVGMQKTPATRTWLQHEIASIAHEASRETRSIKMEKYFDKYPRSISINIE